MRAYVDTSVVRMRIVIAVVSVCFGLGLLLSSQGFVGGKLVTSLGVGVACILFGILAAQEYIRQYVYANIPVLEVSDASFTIRDLDSRNTNEVCVPDVAFLEPRRTASGKLGYRYYIDVHMKNAFVFKICISDLSISPGDIFGRLQEVVPWRDGDGIAASLGRG